MIAKALQLLISALPSASYFKPVISISWVKRMTDAGCLQLAGFFM